MNGPPITLRGTIPDEGEFYSIDPWIADAVLETERCRGRVLELTPDAERVRRVLLAQGKRQMRARLARLARELGHFRLHKLKPGRLRRVELKLLTPNPSAPLGVSLTTTYRRLQTLPLSSGLRVRSGAVLVSTLEPGLGVLEAANDRLTRAGWAVTVEGEGVG